MSIQNLLIFFILASILGWVYEVINQYFKLKKIKNRGFLKGPYLPIYGFGVLLAIFILSFYFFFLIKIILFLFFITILELITGLFFLRRGMQLWNYAEKNHLNYKGIIGPRYSLFWLGGFLIFYYTVYPNIDKILDFICFYNLVYPIYLIFVIMFIDWVLSINKLFR